MIDPDYPFGFRHLSENVFLTILTISEASPWCIDPDNIQMAEVDAFFIVPVAAGAAFGPDVVWTCSRSLRLCCV